MGMRACVYIHKSVSISACMYISTRRVQNKGGKSVLEGEFEGRSVSRADQSTFRVTDYNKFQADVTINRSDSLQALGEVDVMLVDKTGTLTSPSAPLSLVAVTIGDRQYGKLHKGNGRLLPTVTIRTATANLKPSLKKTDHDASSDRRKNFRFFEDDNDLPYDYRLAAATCVCMS